MVPRRTPSAQMIHSQRSFTHAFFTKVLPLLNNFHKITLEQNYNEDFFLNDYTLSELTRVTQTCEKLHLYLQLEFTAESQDFASTAAFGGVRKLPQMPEVKELKPVSCSLQKKLQSSKAPRHRAVETGATLQPLKSNVREGTMPISF